MKEKKVSGTNRERKLDLAVRFLASILPVLGGVGGALVDSFRKGGG